jgi:hypothetical protein
MATKPNEPITLRFDHVPGSGCSDDGLMAVVQLGDSATGERLNISLPASALESLMNAITEASNKALETRRKRGVADPPMERSPFEQHQFQSFRFAQAKDGSHVLLQLNAPRLNSIFG